MPFTGDLDEMVTRRIVRAGVVFNRTSVKSHVGAIGVMQVMSAREYVLDGLTKDFLDMMSKTAPRLRLPGDTPIGA